MNEKMILSMFSSYLNGRPLSYEALHSICKKLFLSSAEQEQIVKVLREHGVIIDEADESHVDYLQTVQPYVLNGYISYERFNVLFGKNPYKKQYEIVEYLFANGVELRDSTGEQIISEADIAALTDSYCITSEDKYIEEALELKDEEIFIDDTLSDEATVFNDHIKQSNMILCKLIQDGNSQAKQDLCVKNQGLVQKCANYFYRVYGNNLDISDLEQAGYIGLIKAAEKFDLSLNNAFSTYAAEWIKQSIRREIMDTGFLIRLPVHVMDRIIQISRTENMSDIDHMDYNERVMHIAQKLQMSFNEVERYMEIRQRYRYCASLNILVGEDQDTELEELIEDTEAISVEEVAEKSMLAEAIYNALDTLEEREKKVIMYRFGFVDGNSWTLEQLGSIFGVTRERIRQIEEKALKKLRHPSRSKKLKDYLD